MDDESREESTVRNYEFSRLFLSSLARLSTGQERLDFYPFSDPLNFKL